MINSVLYSIFISLALRMSVITVFIVIIKAVFKTKLSAKMHCVIWMLMIIQMLFCITSVSIPTRTSIYNVVQLTQPEAVQMASEAIKSFDMKNVVAFVWIAGGCILALWYTGVHLIYKRKVNKYETIDTKEAFEALEEAKTMLGISDCIKLRRGSTAQMMGKTIILPGGYTGDEMKQIMLHELCHYKNKDSLKLWAAIAVVCFNWFNPLVWYAFKVLRTDIEMMCDDSVLKITDSKKEYARVLVKTAAQRNHFIPGAASVHNGANEVIRRVKRIVYWERKKPFWMIAAICVCITVSCLCLTDAVSVAVENSVEEITSTPKPEPVSEFVEHLTENASPAPTAEEQPQVETQTDFAVTEKETEPSVSYENSESTDYQSQQDYIYNTHQSEPANSGYAEEKIYDEHQPNEEEANIAESEQNENLDPDVEIGSQRDDVYSQLGDPESVSGNGSKETYQLDDGRTAVLQYDGDTLESGYIINGDE